MYNIIISLIIGLIIAVAIYAWAAVKMGRCYRKAIDKLGLENERLIRKMEKLIKEK